MNTGRVVGVFVPDAVLWRIVLRRPTYEAATEYAVAARRLGMEAVLFSPSGYRLRGRQVRGYVWRDGLWCRWRGELPRVIHSRILPSRQTVHLLQALRGQLGAGLFNPFVFRDKWRVWRQLSADVAVDTGRVQAFACYDPTVWRNGHKTAPGKLGSWHAVYSPDPSRKAPGAVSFSTGQGLNEITIPRENGSLPISPAGKTRLYLAKDDTSHYMSGPAMRHPGACAT